MLRGNFPETINEIKVVENDEGYAGYEIITSSQSIKIEIDNDQNCCENFGYLASEDDFSDYIDAEILSITTTDTCLITKDVPSDFDEGGIIFVNVNTSKGTLQFAVYNGHNGYYGHAVHISSNQFTLSTSL